MDATIRVQPPDGPWETLGSSRLHGVYPEGIQASANVWGSDALSFIVRREPGAVWPDLLPFSKVELEVGGVVVWGGRIHDNGLYDAERLYDRVIVVAEDPGAFPFRVERTKAHRFIKGFKRTHVLDSDKQLNATFAATLGDAFLADHSVAPLREGRGEADALPIECRGWQYHLDDDALDRVYGISRLLSWVDHRSERTHNRTTWPSSYEVNPQGGEWIELAMPSHTASTAVGVRIDLGEYNSAKEISLTITDNVGHPNAAADALVFRARAHSDINGQFGAVGNYSEALALYLAGGENKTGSYNVVFPTPYRYVTMFMECMSTLNLSATRSAVVITAATVYGDAGYNPLRASGVVKDVVPRTAPLLTTRGVQDTTVTLPEYFTDGHKSTREVIEAVNAVHAWQPRVGVDRDVAYRPYPATPAYAIGAWSGSRAEEGPTVARGDVRTVLGGEEPHPSRLLLGTGELLRMLDRSNPDTGDFGRDGRIVAVNYDHDSETARLALGNETGKFEEQLGRFGVLSGQL